jgi:hypothetical protein
LNERTDRKLIFDVLHRPSSVPDSNGRRSHLSAGAGKIVRILSIERIEATLL